MSSRYPRFGGDRTIKTWDDAASRPITCAACEERPIRLVDIQVSWFRGDDDIYAVCVDHLKLARRRVDQFLALVERARAT